MVTLVEEIQLTFFSGLFEGDTCCTTSSAHMQILAPMHTADLSRTAAGFPSKSSTPSSMSGDPEQWGSRSVLQMTTTTAQSRMKR